MSRNRTKRRQPSFGIFAEGSRPTDPDLGKFKDLWRHLFKFCGGAQDANVHVYGFSKKNIILLKEPPDSPRRGWSEEPLDILIRRSHEEDEFDNVIVAFDRWPKNQEIKTKPWCLRKEVDWILEAFIRRELLPDAFHRDAKTLLKRYAQYPRQPRGSGRPPLGSLEFVFMEPNFEGLLVEDESAVLKALELKHRPRKDWPNFNSDHREPGERVLQPAIDCAAGYHKRSFTPFKQDKHGWALKIIQQAAPHSGLWSHPIATRLLTLLR